MAQNKDFWHSLLNKLRRGDFFKSFSITDAKPSTEFVNSHPLINKFFHLHKTYRVTHFAEFNGSICIPQGRALVERFTPHPSLFTAKKAAFTLAEVLITIGIIGVVAAMTLPALIQNKQNKELQTALLKNYSIIQQVLEKMALDRGARPKTSDFGYLEFAPEFMKYFNHTVKCSESQEGCASKTENENDSTDKTLIKEYLTYNKSRNVSTTYFDDGKFRTVTEYYLFENQNSDLLIITVDVNGIKKKPNIWGHDLFSFQLLENGKLVPAGTPDTKFHDKNTYCSANSSNKLNGIGCTYYAITDRNYWKNLP